MIRRRIYCLLSQKFIPTFIDPVSAPLLAFATPKSGASGGRERDRESLGFGSGSTILHPRSSGDIFLTTANVSSNTFRTGDAVAVNFFHAVVSNWGGKVLLFPHFGSSGLIVAITKVFLKLESL